jgi:serine/threonine protein kinase
MHSVGAIHRDLKPENLLLMSPDPKSEAFLHIKIADFGLSALGAHGEGVESTKLCG